MSKMMWKPGTMVYPLPAIMVSCGSMERSNIITVAWTGTICTDWCGVKSGEKYDKFKEMNLTKEKANIVACPMIKESPVSIECKVKEIKELGSHHMFIAEVVAVNADEKYFDETGKFCLEKCELITYSHGQYYTLGENIGRFGFSVKK